MKANFTNENSYSAVVRAQEWANITHRQQMPHLKKGTSLYSMHLFFYVFVMCANWLMNWLIKNQEDQFDELQLGSFDLLFHSGTIQYAELFQDHKAFYHCKKGSFSVRYTISFLGHQLMIYVKRVNASNDRLILIKIYMIYI